MSVTRSSFCARAPASSKNIQDLSPHSFNWPSFSRIYCRYSPLSRVLRPSCTPLELNNSDSSFCRRWVRLALWYSPELFIIRSYFRQAFPILFGSYRFVFVLSATQGTTFGLSLILWFILWIPLESNDSLLALASCSLCSRLSAFLTSLRRYFKADSELDLTFFILSVRYSSILSLAETYSDQCRLTLLIYSLFYCRERWIRLRIRYFQSTYFLIRYYSFLCSTVFIAESCEICRLDYQLASCLLLDSNSLWSAIFMQCYRTYSSAYCRFCFTFISYLWATNCSAWLCLIVCSIIASLCLCRYLRIFLRNYSLYFSLSSFSIAGCSALGAGSCDFYIYRMVSCLFQISFITLLYPKFTRPQTRPAGLCNFAESVCYTKPVLVCYTLFFRFCIYYALSLNNCQASLCTHSRRAPLVCATHHPEQPRLLCYSGSPSQWGGQLLRAESANANRLGQASRGTQFRFTLQVEGNRRQLILHQGCASLELQVKVKQRLSSYRSQLSQSGKVLDYKHQQPTRLQARSAGNPKRQILDSRKEESSAIKLSVIKDSVIQRNPITEFTCGVTSVGVSKKLAQVQRQLKEVKVEQVGWAAVAGVGVAAGLLSWLI